MAFKRFTLIAHLLTLTSISLSADWKCTDLSCADASCSAISKDCRDPTKALVIPSLSACNCCEFCITFQGEGDDCLIGTPGQTMPDTMCAPGLKCSSTTKKCEAMTQDDPDFFEGYECPDGKTCNCTIIGDNGEKIPIFGKFDYNKNLDKEKQCGCSIAAYKAANQINKMLPFEANQPTARCLSNGQYDPLQCVGNFCFCVDRATGQWDSTAGLEYILNIRPGYPECFDSEIHKAGKYYTRCETERNILIGEKDSAEVEGFKLLYGKRVNCNPDGSYVNPEDEIESN